MGKRGPRAKPAVLKLVQGTFRPDRAKRAKKPRDAATTGTKCPAPPSFLGRVAKIEWRRIAPGLRKAGLLTPSETMTLAAYCNAKARWQEFDKVVTDQGATFVTEKGYVCQRPEVTLAHKEREAMVKYASYFGLNPADRIFVDPAEPATDPTEDFLFGKRTG